MFAAFGWCRNATPTLPSPGHIPPPLHNAKGEAKGGTNSVTLTPDYRLQSPAARQPGTRPAGTPTVPWPGLPRLTPVAGSPGVQADTPHRAAHRVTRQSLDRPTSRLRTPAHIDKALEDKMELHAAPLSRAAPQAAFAELPGSEAWSRRRTTTAGWIALTAALLETTNAPG